MGANKTVADSIAVKMKDFAGDLYLGMTTKTTDDVIKNFAKKGLEAEKIYGSKKGIEDALKLTKDTTGYKIGNFVGGGIRDSIKDYSKAKEIYEAAKKTKKTEEALEKLKPSIVEAVKNGHSTIDSKGNRKYDVKAIAGTAFTAGVAGRVVTGGGLYRDRYGNVNVPGIPFI